VQRRHCPLCLSRSRAVAVARDDRLALRPLPGLAVIRDLMVDMSLFWKPDEGIERCLQNSL